MGRLISDWYREGEVLAPWARSGPDRNPYWDEVRKLLPCSPDKKHYDSKTGLYETFEERVDRMQRELLESQAEANARASYPSPNFPSPEVYSDDEEISEFFGEYDSDSDRYSTCSTEIVEEGVESGDGFVVANTSRTTSESRGPLSRIVTDTTLTRRSDVVTFISEGLGNSDSRSATESNRPTPWIHRNRNPRPHPHPDNIPAIVSGTSSELINSDDGSPLARSIEELMRLQTESNEMRLQLLHELRRFLSLVDDMVELSPENRRPQWVDMRSKVSELERKFIEDSEASLDEILNALDSIQVEGFENIES